MKTHIEPLHCSYCKDPNPHWYMVSKDGVREYVAFTDEEYNSLRDGRALYCDKCQDYFSNKYRPVP